MVITWYSERPGSLNRTKVMIAMVAVTILSEFLSRGNIRSDLTSKCPGPNEQKY